MAGWHHRLNGYEFELSMGDGEGQGSLACCSPWSCKQLDTTERLATTPRICGVNTSEDTSVTHSVVSDSLQLHD